MKKILALLLTLALLLGLTACGSPVPNVATAPDATVSTTAPTDGTEATLPLDIDGAYDTKDEVALYIHLFGKLPSNYVTKSQAKAIYGWKRGSLDSVAPGMAIGGDSFGNREGLLPKKSGRTWTECDIGTIGSSSRGAKRIVFSNDGLIYYTDDHYQSFQLLYGDPNA